MSPALPRAARRAGATVMVSTLLFVACSDDSALVDADTSVSNSAVPSSAPATSAGPGTTAAPIPTTAPGTTAGPGTTGTPVTTAPSPPTTDLPGDAALRALEPFLAAVDAIMADAADAWPVIDAARAAGAEVAPDEAWVLADDIGAVFYSLASLIPHGLAPEVRAGAVTLIYDVGNHVAPFVFAPGFDFASWDPAWDEARAAGGAAVPVDRAALVAAAEAIPDVLTVAPTSQVVADDAILEVVVVRSFGHNLTSAPLPYAVRWLGELPSASVDELPACANVPFEGGEFTGTFVEGAGGCAIVYYGTTDAASYEAQLQEFLADPGAAGTPPGEIVSVVWDDATAAYAVYGSWE